MVQQVVKACRSPRVLPKPGLPANLPRLLPLIHVPTGQDTCLGWRWLGSWLTTFGPRRTSYLSLSGPIPALPEPWGPGASLTDWLYTFNHEYSES